MEFVQIVVDQAGNREEWQDEEEGEESYESVNFGDTDQYPCCQLDRFKILPFERILNRY